jgi:transposase-like protein
MLEEQLAQASPDLLRELLGTFINTLLSAEADAVCGAGYGERSPERVNQRNGYRHRDFDTRAGTLDVAVPKLRQGSYFPEWLLERRTRAEKALTSVVATSYLLGVSTRRMNKLVQSLGITGLSKSQVSTMSAELDAHVEDFRTRSWPRQGRSRSWPPTRWCSRSARAAGWSRCTPWSRPGSTPTGTGRSSASRSPAQRTAPAGSPSSAT